MKFILSLTILLFGCKQLYPINLVDACSGGGNSTFKFEFKIEGVISNIEDVEDKNIDASKYLVTNKLLPLCS